MAETAPIVFISGGVRSGKSRYAEQLACEYAMKASGNLHYIACGQASDEEMTKRIARHKKDRVDSGFNWKTWEQPREVIKLSNFFMDTDIILLDCLTTLLNNEFFHGAERWKEVGFCDQVMDSIISGIEGIADQCDLLIIVSNEVLNDPLLNDEFILTYKYLLGKIHQQVVSMAKRAYLVEAGIPLQMKGVD